LGQAEEEFMLKFSKNESETKEYFFALEIDIDRVKSAIWTIEENQTKLVSLGETQSYQNEEDLLESVDASLSSAIEKFSPDGQMKEPNKVIFGLSTDWIDQNKILPEKAEILKKISQKLELTPLGFMIVPEAIAHWLKKLEGVPPTAILIGLSAKRIVVSLIDLGRVVQTSLVVRSENLGADLAEGLSRLEKDTPFPARILLYDGEEKIEQARQDLINWPWTEEKITFLHLPKVEILSADFDIKAIVLASASQMAEVQGLEIVQEEKEKLQEEPLEVEETKGVEEKEEEVLSVPVESPIDLLGFIKGGDINEVKPPVFNEEPEISQEKTEPDKFLKIKKLASLRKNLFNFSWLKKIIPQRTIHLNRESTLSVRDRLGNKSLLITILASVFFRDWTSPVSWALAWNLSMNSWISFLFLSSLTRVFS